MSVAPRMGLSSATSLFQIHYPTFGFKAEGRSFVADHVALEAGREVAKVPLDHRRIAVPKVTLLRSSADRR